MRARRLWWLALLLPVLQAAAAETSPTVVLLHGLIRSSASMEKMADALTAQGYDVCNIDYPSTAYPVETLATDHVLPAIKACAGDNAPISFVTHSLGGILVRQLRASGAPLVFGRVVMLGPPNGGSEVVDKLGGLALFQWMNGPAGNQLGTVSGLPVQLGATDLDVGIIAGNSTINPLLSLLIPGDDDGKVAIEHAKLDGMRDFIVLPVSHPFLMRDDEVIAQTLQFLQNGRFTH